MKYLKIISFVCLALFSFISKSYGQDSINQQLINISLRTIGHEILLASGDSTSLVLAIEKDSNRYKIPFESKFQFNPSELATITGDIIEKNNIAERYIVEVENCETNQIIYSYEIKNGVNIADISCQKRQQPFACYTIFITLLEADNLNLLDNESKNDFSSYAFWANNGLSFSLVISLFLIIILVLIFKKKKNKSDPNPDLIQIGQYQFDKKEMFLIYSNVKTALTSKESDLLFLFYSSANTVLERDNILQIVWGDEGDYVGRTLDVFISKLRKKLMEDSSLKIINIRGVGYKFIMG